MNYHFAIDFLDCMPYQIVKKKPLDNWGNGNWSMGHRQEGRTYANNNQPKLCK